MGQNKKSKKKIAMRISPDILNYIDHCAGKNRTQKFESLVRFCMTREKILREIEVQYEKRIKETEEEIRGLEQKKNQLRRDLKNG